MWAERFITLSSLYRKNTIASIDVPVNDGKRDGTLSKRGDRRAERERVEATVVMYNVL